MLTTLLRAQSLNDIEKRLKLLAQNQNFQFDDSGFSSLPKIDFHCDRENANRSDYYHVVDLNFDGLMDLIYSGPCSPNDQTAIFLNTGKVFKRVYDYPGKIVSLEHGATETVINILKEACCCEFYSQYTQVVINDKSLVRKNTIVFGNKTTINVGSRIREEKVMGTLRTTPHVNDAITHDDCNKAVVRGNQLKRIHDFSTVVQLNRSGSWWLILYPESNERSWVGWMRLN